MTCMYNVCLFGLIRYSVH